MNNFIYGNVRNIEYSFLFEQFDFHNRYVGLCICGVTYNFAFCGSRCRDRLFEGRSSALKVDSIDKRYFLG